MQFIITLFKYKNKSIAFKFNLKKVETQRGNIFSNWGVEKDVPNGSKNEESGFLAVALAENIKTGQRERNQIN